MAPLLSATRHKGLVGQVGNFFRDGVVLPVPGFLLCRNRVCDAIGAFGLSWAEKRRSQIFMSAFIVSFLTLFIVGSTVSSLLTVPPIVRSVPFMQGTVTIANTSAAVTSSFSYYAGLNSIVVDGCTDGPNRPTCPPHSQLWATVDCGTYLNHCDECVTAASATIVPVIIALVTQLPQIVGDLQRSTTDGDFPCMKVIGVVTGIIGMVGNLLAVRKFTQACFVDLQPSSTDVTITRQYGAALVCLLLATALKVVDIAVHLLVPAPRGRVELSEEQQAKEAEQMELELAPLVEEVVVEDVMVVDRW